MAMLWVTEALPIPATALLPIALFPLLTGGAISVRSATAPYAHDLIFLFMGGFLLALAMQQWGLHRRIALRTILLVGTKPVMLVGGFMLASAFLSMWVSNTATVVMMLPIAMSVVELVRRELVRTPDPDAEPRASARADVHTATEPRAATPAEPTQAKARGPDQPFNFAICLMLGTAYAASIGGIGTLIGTPPNALLAAFLSDQLGIEISFVRWMAVGVPLVLVSLPITWLTLTKIVFPIRLRRLPGGRELIRNELEAHGRMSRAEWAVLVVFILTAAAWITRPLLTRLQLPGSPGVCPLAGLTDAGIAMGAAVVLFAFPIHPQRGEFLLTWRQAAKLPWGILILFGGGLSLASAVKATGVAEFIARGVTTAQGLPVLVVVLLVTTMIVFLTELTSNTATTATFLPILAAVAVGLSMDPLLLIVPMTIAASCAFMMPVATPPNAIVFGSGEITIPQMCKAGLWLNLIGIVLVMLLAYAVIVPVLAVEL